jgi:tRNA-2-methylthio-N6-dimethylallyladenosine synthase
MDGQLPKDVVQERYLRLTALQDEISWAENRARVGRTVELISAALPSPTKTRSARGAAAATHAGAAAGSARGGRG